MLLARSRNAANPIARSLPPPTAKRMKHEQGQAPSGADSSPKKKGHRAMPSISTTDGSPKSVNGRSGSTATGTFKVPSAKQVRSKDEDVDDSVSIAESSSGPTRTRKSEQERYQFFADEPLCDDFEPNRAHCTSCKEWIPLSEKVSYVIGPWMKHTKQCAKGASITTKSQRAKSVIESDVDDSASVATAHTRRTEAERKAYLEADPDAQDIGPNEVTCRRCSKTIKLGGRTNYQLRAWDKHQAKCSGAVPSSRVATAERKLKLVNDSQAKHFTTCSVDCNVCGDRVTLEGEGDYKLTKWEEHKGSCKPTGTSVQDLSSAEAATAPSPGKTQESETTTGIRPPPSTSSAHSQPSVASSNATLVVAESSTSSPTRSSLKRRREDDNAEETRDAPAQRPRSDTYVAPEGNVPGLWDWIKLPWQSFVRGLALGSRSSTLGAD
ncbi:hypothetical protein PUNSTDRAFT_143044 [Punctularia strigosozonata HHB-11173 SS5]|uniref:uncharacterized protein n=1 Tax=Punctularia strigosozonata (strain HHB-11173) TaxID=741275 RepID=UPI00044182EE|nr:uncharacterized protein PUNSTDRAFT_143044 [Punctularia strigosozonata HHB-11173 SS5]EIN09497.1 hypothetical protein PUNSTDRAFT_143044 [Punctularia strigosozonata HHB-11173 SS5]